jgi:putative aldouronate transport system permease protein
MANVNPEIYEAATVDGANRFQKAIKITLPSLVPIITFVFILSMGNIIHDDFDQIFNLMNPGVMQVSDVISTYTYRMGMVLMQYSYGAAVGLFKNIIAIVLIFLTNYILKKVSDNEYRII